MAKREGCVAEDSQIKVLCRITGVLRRKSAQEMVQETVDTNCSVITSAVIPARNKQTRIIKYLHSHKSVTSFEYKVTRQVIIFILHQKAGIHTLL